MPRATQGALALPPNLFFMLPKDTRTFFHCCEREGKGERETEKHQIGLPPLCACNGNRTHNLGMCPDWESNPEPFSYGMMLQPAQPHRPGPPVNCLVPSSSSPFSLLQTFQLLVFTQSFNKPNVTEAGSTEAKGLVLRAQTPGLASRSCC